MGGFPAILFLLVTIAVLLSGFPVAGGLIVSSLLFAAVASLVGWFDPALFSAIAPRIYGVLTNSVLLAIPMFVFMGMVLEKSGMAEAMFRSASRLFSEKPGGLLAAVTLTGVLMAASTGIVGASVVTLGLLALPALLRAGISPPLATGSIAAAGTLGQIIPPSIVLIVLGDQMSNAWQKAQTDAGNFAPDTVTVSDLFAGALLPGLLLAGLYLAYQMVAVRRMEIDGDIRPHPNYSDGNQFAALAIPLLLVLVVLGSILTGIATPAEAASVGAVGVFAVAALRSGTVSFLRPAIGETVHLVSMIFFIVIAASIFSLIFRGLGGDAVIENALAAMPGGTWGALIGVMVLIFVLGFFLEFLEITYMVVPLVAPVLLVLPMADGSMMSPVWLGVLFAINLQTSFLTPPLGVSLFYLRSVAPDSMGTPEIWRGAAPFVLLQLLGLVAVMLFPSIATFLPTLMST